MSHYLAGILRIILLEAGAALLIFRRASRKTLVAFLVVAALGLFSWTKFGELRGDGNYVHRWEQFHFYFAAKYLPEIRYDNLYKAILLADREGSREAGEATVGVSETRDLTNFEEISVDRALEDPDSVRARFSDEKWKEFKHEWMEMRARGGAWTSVLRDHGNTSSPAWALIATPIAKLVPSTEGGEKVLAFLDIGLLLVLFATVFWAFGARAASVSLWIFAFVPFSFDYLFGSFLRWDWLFATGMSLCMWKRGRYLTAGAFLAYAVASKLFPIFFALGLGVTLVRAVAKHRPWAALSFLLNAMGKLSPVLAFPLRILGRAALTQEAEAERAAAYRAMRSVLTPYLRFAAGALLCGALFVGVSSAVYGGPSIWKDYAARIEVANHEKFYGNQYSLQTVFLQLVADTKTPPTGPWVAPSKIKQELPDVDVNDYKTPLFIARILLTLLILALLLRADPIEAMSAGPFFVFTWLTVNAYYWNMLAFPALAWASRRVSDGKKLAPLIALHSLLVGYYLYQHTNHGYAEGYFVACMMLVLIAWWAVSEAWDWLLGR